MAARRGSWTSSQRINCKMDFHEDYSGSQIFRNFADYVGLSVDLVSLYYMMSFPSSNPIKPTICSLFRMSSVCFLCVQTTTKDCCIRVYTVYSLVQCVTLLCFHLHTLLWTDGAVSVYRQCQHAAAFSEICLGKTTAQIN